MYICIFEIKIKNIQRSNSGCEMTSEDILRHHRSPDDVR